jgi:hypothetical protein
VNRKVRVPWVAGASASGPDSDDLELERRHPIGLATTPTGHLDRVLTFNEEEMARDMYERRLAIREAEEERWRRAMDHGEP